MSKADVLREVSNSLRSGTPVLFATGLGWEETARARLEAAAELTKVETFQEGYGPQDESSLEYCPKHDLSYGGRLGCPVCGRRHQP